MSDLLARATGCLMGVALGDALGRATEFMTPEQIRARFGWLDHFAAPPEVHPRHADPPGIITDDTEQTLLIAALLAEGGPLTPERVAVALVAAARSGFNPYIGPSTRRALTRLMEGESPYVAGRGGTTNGAAMRVAPVGIVHAGDREGALRDAVAAGIPTHNTRNALQGAAAVACGVAAAMVDGATVADVVAAAQAGAARGREFGEWSWATPLDKRIALAVDLAERAAGLPDALQALYDFVGVGLDPAESVAAAVGVVVAARGDPMKAILAGVNIGGDTDTIAGIAGSLCGALHGIDALDATLAAQVEQVNHLDLRSVARSLIQAGTRQ